MKRVRRAERALATHAYRYVAVRNTGPLGALTQEEVLAVLAAFFCLLFFAAESETRYSLIYVELT
jgi:hypothetical protein